ncbi:hypothetical protein AVEN_99850-1 [Araneus ventricosus]|uniref:Uncharacterized protein n=1 Tax=Araneus ventricosus TaxID=182803 RepID=A0A4Y2MH28_ARAVE|nr:hypothetical protein AVEN_99850-1 [Araneus ventricosus]
MKVDFWIHSPFCQRPKSWEILRPATTPPPEKCVKLKGKWGGGQKRGRGGRQDTSVQVRLSEATRSPEPKTLRTILQVTGESDRKREKSPGKYFRGKKTTGKR